MASVVTPADAVLVAAVVALAVAVARLNRQLRAAVEVLDGIVDALVRMHERDQRVFELLGSLPGGEDPVPKGEDQLGPP